MTRSISVVKREIRILGLDFCNKRLVTGAVMRGGQFLDGVFTIPDHGRLRKREIAERILATRYFPELRAIMVHDPPHRSKAENIEKITGLPVVTISTVRPGRRGFRVHRTKRGKLWVRSRLPSETLDRIVSLTWTFGRIPEPARVAHVLARTRIPKAMLG